MAAVRLSARGGSAASASASVTSSSVRLPVSLGVNFAPQSFSSSGTTTTAVFATLTQRQPISISSRRKADSGLGGVANCSRTTKFVASLLTTAAIVTCQAENQAVQSKQKVVSKAPSGSKEKSMSPGILQV